MATLKIGDLAPVFKRQNQHGEENIFVNLPGKKVIYTSYLKDTQSGCTSEACNLNDNYSMWLAKGYEVIGVSPDSVASHKKFADKYGLGFNLIADTEHKILEAYGAWGEKSMYGKSYMGVLRTTFVINETGNISDVFEKVDTKNHTKQIISKIQP